jgi:adenine-specific DNA-methyltransferase
MMMATVDKKIYKTSLINNRRYLGNKYKLLPFITKVVNDECTEIESVADIFAGTGAVSSAFNDKIIITNDLMYSNYICNLAWFGAQEYNPQIIIDYVVGYNVISEYNENYMTENFANTYFSYNDCSKIGFIREDIENSYDAGRINERERAILITSLLYAMDKIAKTCGHYDAYRKGAEFNSSLELYVPLAEVKNRKENKCFNEDANELVKNILADLVYIDPPYNSRQYCDAYHLLENVARWEKPEVYGVARKMNRDSMKSKYCTKSATEAFEDLIKNIKAKYILFSYNNMATKGNDRSNAKISDEDIMRILQNKGNVKVFSENYKAFSTGKSNISDNAERLFLCTCFSEEK